MIPQSILRQVLRYLLVGMVLIILASSVFLLIRSQDEYDRLAAFITLMTGIFSVLATPPVSNLVDQAFFEASNTGAKDVRIRLKEYWIDQYLRAEQRAINGASSPSDDSMPIPNGNGNGANNGHAGSAAPEEDQFSCDLPTTLEGVNKLPNGELAFSNYTVFDPSRRVFAFDNADTVSRKLQPTIVEDETLISFFKEFTNYVENDRKYTGEFIVLMGERGTRKTLQLLELAEELVKYDTRVPIYLNLFSWAAGCKQLEVWLQDEIVRQYNIVRWKARRLVETNYLILLLDGFEEVPHDRRRHLVHAIGKFLNNRTRSGGAADRPIDLRDSVVIAVKTPPEIESLLDGGSGIGIADHTDNYVDLYEHVEELLDTLQNVSTGKAPVALLHIRMLEKSTVEEYMICQFRRKVRDEVEKSLEKLPTDEQKRKRQQMEAQGEALARTTLRQLQRGKGALKNTDILWHHMLQVLRRSPFLLRAFISSYRYDDEKKRLESTFETMERQERQQLHGYVQRAKKNTNDISLYEVLQETIIRRYVQQSLRYQPGNIGPHGSVERDQLLREMATAMQRRRQRVLDNGDVVFYLEDIGLRMLIQKKPRRLLQYKGLVAALTALIFFAMYLVFLLFIQEMRPEIAILVGVLIYLFGRSFGWLSCGSIHEDRTELQYPLRWFYDAGLSAALFMGLIVGLVFFEMTRIVYEAVNQPPLLYEAVVSATFTFALFQFVGGLELGRRYDIVAQPYEGRRFLLVTTLVAGGGWFLFFFLFMFWPRARFELLTNIQIQEIVPRAATYAAISGTFIGFISGLVLSHLYVRHLVLYWYLGLQRGLRSQYAQVLDHNARPEIGILRKLGGGYVFRHRFIMNYFRKDYPRNVDLDQDAGDSDDG